MDAELYSLRIMNACFGRILGTGFAKQAAVYESVVIDCSRLSGVGFRDIDRLCLDASACSTWSMLSVALWIQGRLQEHWTFDSIRQHLADTIWIMRLRDER